MAASNVLSVDTTVSLSVALKSKGFGLSLQDLHGAVDAILEKRLGKAAKRRSGLDAAAVLFL